MPSGRLRGGEQRPTVSSRGPTPRAEPARANPKARPLLQFGDLEGRSLIPPRLNTDDLPPS
jgi:hypothetical protein